MDPFASHVIRALLLLLSPTLSSSDKSTSNSYSTLRSKKSAAWKARQAPMKNVFALNKSKVSDTSNLRSTPQQFRAAAVSFVRILREELGENEIRALAADKVASPVLQVRVVFTPENLICSKFRPMLLVQMMLELEAEQGTSDESGSLMDRVLVGMITSYSRL
jgi:nucleolar protein 9